MYEFIEYETVDEYQQHYIEIYCKAPVITFDEIPVYFDRNRFSHAFYRSSKRNDKKDSFSNERAQRIDWIKHALQDVKADLRVGWNKYKRCNDFNSRVAVVAGNYVVVIRFFRKKEGSLCAKFVTAYIADENALPLILQQPKWNSSLTKK